MDVFQKHHGNCNAILDCISKHVGYKKQIEKMKMCAWYLKIIVFSFAFSVIAPWFVAGICASVWVICNLLMVILELIKGAI